MKNNEVKKIIIIGAGISGLTCGIYAQKSGYLTEIFERNPEAGGLCSAWKRDNFPIDGCIHWMTGTKKGTEIYSMWQSIEAFKDEDIIHPDNFGVVDYQGTKVTFWCNLIKLKNDWIKISPVDKRLINRFVKMVVTIQNMPLPTDLPLSIMGVLKLLKFGIKVIPYLPTYLYTKTKQKIDFAKKFKSEALRYALERIVPGDNNLYSSIYAFGTVAVGNGGVIKGGSSTLIKNLVSTYEEKGGMIHYCSDVEEIIVENGIAKGIRLKNGKEFKADYVVSSSDYKETVKMLNNKFHDRGFEKRFNNPKVYPTPTCVYVSLKVDYEEIKQLDIPETFEFECSPIAIGDTKEESIKIRTYSYDPAFIKDGNVLITVLYHLRDNNYPYWNKLRENYKEYLAKKEEIGNETIDRIIAKFPSLSGKIKLLDVCTPKTYNRYTNAYCGAYMPFSYTSKASMYYSNGKIKGVKKMFLAGQWTVMPGGIPIAMMSGKFALQRILKEDKRNYKITPSIRFIYPKTYKK